MTKSIFILLFLLPMHALAGVVRGKITDTKGEALPFATVFIKGTTLGTSANADGIYQLSVPAGNHDIVCQYMGFRQGTYHIAVRGEEVIDHNFSLEEQNLEMKEFVMKATDDPALYIMRKVIARRSFHLNQVKTFQTGIYMKGVLKTRSTPKKVLGQKIDPEDLGLDSSRKGIIYLCEEIASYYTQGNQERTQIHSVRESGDPNGMGFSQFPPVISFYENNIRISSQINPRGFISPVSDNALFYYKFRLEGDFTEEGRTIYKISVTPKRKFEPLMQGVIYVVDEDWALHSLNLLATKKGNMELLDTIRIEQVYLPLEKDTWVIKQQVLYPTMKILGFDFVGNFVTVYNDQLVNKPVPDSVMNNKFVSVYDKTANKKDTSYWTNNRPVPLEKDESKDYVVKDSLRLRYEDPAYLDSMRRKDNKVEVMDILLNGISHRGKKDAWFIRTNSLLTLTNYNTIEGLNVAPRVFFSIKTDSFSAVTGILAARYGFENTHFNAIGRVGYTSRSKQRIGRFWRLGIEAGKYVYQFNPNNPIEELFNTFSTLFYRQNYLKLYERWNGAVFLTRNAANGFRWHAQLGFQQRLPLNNSTDFSFASSSAPSFTENTPVEFVSLGWAKHNAVIAKLSLSYQPGYTYTQYPDYVMPHRSRWPVFTLAYEKGIPELFQSKTDYDKWRFSIRDNLGLKLLGTLDYHIAAGGFLNTNWVSIPDLNHLHGNQIVLATPYLESFQLAPYYLYSNTKPLYGEAHLEWHLKGFLTNKIPLLRQLRWYLVAGTNTYYADEDLYHAEVYAGIDNLGYDKFRMFRLDVVQGWNSLDQQTTAIRINISTGGVLSFSSGMSDPNSDW